MSTPQPSNASKTILVTGGGSGIGRATCQLFARDGAAVTVLDWNREAGGETVELVNWEGGRAIFCEADVSNAADVERAVAETVREFHRLDIVFANAAVQVNAALEETSEADWNKMLAVNLTGTFHCCKFGARAMKKQGSGCIVICSSGHAFQTYAAYAGYAATKGGLLAFMRSAAIDLAPYGIRVNGIVPGATETNLLRYHFERCPQDKERLLEKIPMARLAQPEDIARGVRLLTSEDASYITGAWLTVDGGLMAQG